MPRHKTRLYYKTLYNKTKEWLQGEIDNESYCLKEKIVLYLEGQDEF